MRVFLDAVEAGGFTAAAQHSQLSTARRPLTWQSTEFLERLRSLLSKSVYA